MRDEQVVERIRRLAIPPAWTKVWICPYENGHIQATGRDARGRKQYLYHHRWREVRDEAKFQHMTAFAEALPKIRARVAEDLKRPGFPREKILATVVRLLETTLIRVGNQEYAQQNGSHGLTTLHNNEAKVVGGKVTFDFKGKSGVHHTIDIRDPQLARLVKRCQELPGQELFAYVDQQGVVRDVTSDDVNRYLREIAGSEFSAKDFRTWAGTVLAAVALQHCGAFETQKQARANISNTVKAVARMLGNTPAICQRCYIHPRIISDYLAGRTVPDFRPASPKASQQGLRPEEKAVLRFLKAA